MKIAWTPEAISDRQAIYRYIEADNPTAAIKLDARIKTAVARLSTFPASARVGRVNGTRELVVHPNYIVVYDTVDQLIRILRVLHAAQQWPPEK